MQEGKLRQFGLSSQQLSSFAWFGTNQANEEIEYGKPHVQIERHANVVVPGAEMRRLSWGGSWYDPHKDILMKQITHTSHMKYRMWLTTQNRALRSVDIINGHTIPPPLETKGAVTFIGFYRNSIQVQYLMWSESIPEACTLRSYISLHTDIQT